MEKEIPEYEENTKNLEAMKRTGAAFTFVSTFEKSKAYEVTENGETQKFIEFIGSSDNEDLVGDVMDLAALKEMEVTAPGTIMLRDHNRSTDKVFGWITEAKVVPENGVYLIVFKAEVDDEDAANVRIWKSISKGRKLGASVTVVILSKKDNPRRTGGMIFKSVKLLEVSIVTVPCNQDSWTLAATASKALALAESYAKSHSSIPAIEKSAANQEEIMTDEKKKDAGTENAETAENVETVEAAETAAEDAPVEKAVIAPFALSIAAKNLHEARRAEAERTKTAPEILEISAKGLFVDEQAKRQPTLWDLFDILCAVKWQLMDRKWAIEQADVADDFDYPAEYKTACEEFSAAAVKSFAYYGGWDMPVDPAAEGGEPASIVETAIDDDETVSNALDIEKAFEDFAGNVSALPLENREKMFAIGKMFVEAAKSAGIPLGFETDNASVTHEPAEEIIRQSAVYADAEKRAADAEEKAAALRQENEIAKAALEVAVEAINQANGQPLQINQ